MRVYLTIFAGTTFSVTECDQLRPLKPPSRPADMAPFDIINTSTGKKIKTKGALRYAELWASNLVVVQLTAALIAEADEVHHAVKMMSC